MMQRRLYKFAHPTQLRRFAYPSSKLCVCISISPLLTGSTATALVELWYYITADTSGLGTHNLLLRICTPRRRFWYASISNLPSPRTTVADSVKTPNPPERSSQTPGLVNPPPGSTPRWDYKNISRADFCKTLYHSPMKMPRLLRCDWEKCRFLHFFVVIEPGRPTSDAEYYIKHLLRVPGDVVPLAWIDTCEETIFFETDGKYYLIDKNVDHLLHFGGKFTSHEDFLAQWETSPRDIQYLPDLDREIVELAAKRRRESFGITGEKLWERYKG
ncbi:hypothetical protein B0H11DRAFT_2007762 [Mycena galericulata]|nr:hypothetical protein B0H11DRAFT_2007762 [Mycena galericulata]